MRIPTRADARTVLRGITLSPRHLPARTLLLAALFLLAGSLASHTALAGGKLSVARTTATIVVNSSIGKVALGMPGLDAVRQAMGKGAVASAAGDQVSQTLPNGTLIARLYQAKVVVIETTSPSFVAKGVHVGSAAAAVRAAFGGAVQSTGNSLYLVGATMLQGNKVHTYFDLSADGTKVASIRMGYFPWLTSCYGGPTQVAASQLPGSQLARSQTWGLRGCPYVVTGNLQIPQGVRLTITPGVIVKFTDANSDLYVTGGELLARGTADTPVIFTALDDQLHGALGTGQYPSPKAGAWYGLGIWTQGGSLTLDHAAVYYAGSDANRGAIWVQGQGAPTLTVQDSLFGYNATVAINATNAVASTTVIQRNAFFGNDTPLWINGGVSIDGSNVFSPAGLAPNKRNGIFLTASASIGNASGAVSWGEQHAPFVLSGDNRVPQGSTLTIKPGVTVKFVDANSDLYVHGGGLVARGTATAPVVFTAIGDHARAPISSAEQVPAKPGDWLGLGIWSEGGTLTLDHAQVYYAGSNTTYGAVYVQGGTNPALTVQNSVLAYNANYALNLSQAPATTVMQHNTFFGNDIPLLIGPAISLDTSNVFHHGAHANTKNAVFLVSGANLAAGTMTLAETEVPIVIQGQFAVRSGTTLVVNPGVILKGLDANAQLYVNGGSLTVAGTGAHPVVMTALTDSAHGSYTTGNGAIPGDWQGVYIDSAARVNAAHLQIFYAGSNGGLHINDPAVVILSNSEIAQGSADGIDAGSSRPISVTNTSIHNNKGFGVNFGSKDIQTGATMTGNTITNNTKGNIAVGGQAVAS